MQASPQQKEDLLTRAPTWGSAVPGRVKKCRPPPPLPPPGGGKDHLLFFLFTKSASPGHCPPPPPLVGALLSTSAQ